MSENIEVVPAYQLKTLDGRFVVVQQAVDRYGHPIVTIDTYSATMERQSTVKIGFKDLGNLRLAIQSFMDAMLESMCDY